MIKRDTYINIYIYIEWKRVSLHTFLLEVRDDGLPNEIGTLHQLNHSAELALHESELKHALGNVHRNETNLDENQKRSYFLDDHCAN